MNVDILSKRIKVFRLEINAVLAWAILAALVGVWSTPAIPFIVDGGIYLEMARAMAERGSLHIADNGGVDGAGPMTKLLTDPIDGKVFPQYPSGYAFIASPFYAFLGVRGLILMNALAAIVCVLITHRIATKLFNREVAVGAAVIFLVATFLANYAFAIWPHVLSLSLALGAVYCTILGAKNNNRHHRLANFFIAGLLIGAGVNIRVDAILMFPVVFFWLRAFALPTDRRSVAALIAGMAPALLLAAYLNQIKFGVFSPFSYGPATGANNAERYLPLMAAGVTGIIGLWLFNLQSIWKIVAYHVVRPEIRTSAIIASVAVIGAALYALKDVLYGVYVLVINLQAHNAYQQVGVEYNEFGQLLFWDYPKKALIQSTPFLPLLIVPIVGFFRGKFVTSVSLCLLAISAPIVFYALNQWHGGGSYNMRYFLPATPFIAILCAFSISNFIEVAGKLEQRTLLIIIVSAAILFVSMQELGRAIAYFYAPASLYPQWVLAGVTAAGAIGFVLNSNSRNFSRIALAAGSLAIAHASFVNLADEAGARKAKTEQLVLAGAIANAMDGEPLIFTTLPVLTIMAEHDGAAIMTPNKKLMGDVIKSINAFSTAGRCVYFHNSIVSDLIAPYIGEGAIDPHATWAASERFPNDPRLGFFVLTSQSEQCRL